MILITGAAGVCGEILQEEFPRARYTDASDFILLSSSSEKYVGDLSCKKFRKLVLGGVKILIHLAGASKTNSSWEDVYKNNIEVCSGLFLDAVSEGVEKIIFASSNHVVGQFELKNSPDIYFEDVGVSLKGLEQPCPDSYYGVSKSFGESLLSYLSFEFGIQSIGLRIGAVLPKSEDRDTAYAERYTKDTECPSSNRIRELEKRLSCLRVSNDRWRAGIRSLIESEWKGYVTKNWVGDGYSWMENEVNA